MDDVKHVNLKPGATMTLPFYGSDVRDVEVVINDPGVPLKLGAEFTCRVVAIRREVVER